MVAEDGLIAPATRRSDRVAPTGDPHVSVPTPAGEVVLVDPRVHRVDVVRRLLALGVSPRTLTTLLPGWDRLIRAVVVGDPVPHLDTPGT